MKIKLYDLHKNDYPNKRGDSFRSLQVFECWVCGAKTNKVVMGGYSGYGVRARCPNSSEEWHHNLEDYASRLRELGHPKSYLEELEKEVEELRLKNKDKIKDDIKGNPDFSLKKVVTNVRSFKKGGIFFCF